MEEVRKKKVKKSKKLQIVGFIICGRRRLSQLFYLYRP